MHLDHLQGERASAPKVSDPTAAPAPSSTWLPQPPPGKGAAFYTSVSRPQAQLPTCQKSLLLGVDVGLRTVS